MPAASPLPYSGGSTDPALKTGDLFFRHGLITSGDIDTILAIQKNNASMGSAHRYFGVLACHLNLITPIDNYHLLNRHNKIFGLEHFFSSSSMVSKKKAARAMDKSRASGIPLITTALEFKLVSRDDLKKILFNLYHIPYRSVYSHQFDKNSSGELQRIIPEHRAQAGGIIPLVMKEEVLLVGITAPGNLDEVKQLSHEFPHHRFKTVFISFFDFTALLPKLYTRESSAVEPEGTAPDIDPLPDFKCRIRNPKTQADRVASLYQQYQRLEKQVNNRQETGQFDSFKEFIIEKHREITGQYHAMAIEFSFKTDNSRVLISASPQTEDETTVHG
ncbi:MAG: hypothetical protein R6V54_05625 [Desulfobacteraceae bacterium]